MTLWRPIIVLFIFITIFSGLATPVLVWGFGQSLFRDSANGSLIEKDGQIIGSILLGQPFKQDIYFWPRPTAHSTRSGGFIISAASNMNPANTELQNQITERLAAFRRAHPLEPNPIPVDILTTSASGLDPHISPQAAMHQIERVAHARGIPSSDLAILVKRYTEPKTFGILGEERVNVLALNLALDHIKRNAP